MFAELTSNTGQQFVIQVTVFRVVTPCSFAVVYQCFKGPCSHLLQGDYGSSMALQIVSLLPHHCTVSQSRRAWLGSSPLWKP